MAQEDWDNLARMLGYTDEEEMLRDLYEEERFSIAQIARKLGAGHATIARRMGIYDIAKRRRGGPNNRPKQTARLHMLDQRLIWSSSSAQIARLLDMHVSTVWKYKFGHEPRGVDHEVLCDNADRGLGEICGDGSTSSPSSGEESEIPEVLPEEAPRGRDDNT